MTTLLPVNYAATTVTPSQLRTTNEAFRQIFHFLFNSNSIMTWLHIAIFFAGLLLLLWVGWLNRNFKCNKTSVECWKFTREMLAGARESTSKFVCAFGISGVLFGIGVWFESKGESGMIVQVMTYSPVIILAVLQVISIIRSTRSIKRHLGVCNATVWLSKSGYTRN